MMSVFNLFIISFLVLVPQISGADVRLVGGRTPYKGRLEVRRDDRKEWGTVCDDNFDENDASVICRMLGFKNTESSLKVEPSIYGPGPGTIWLDDLECVGNETDVSECINPGWGVSNCDHSEDVGVSCQTPIRLADGSSSHSGRVEIQRNGTWESTCYDSFDVNVGKVVCRMLAFSTGKMTINPAMRHATISLTKWNCTGSEKDVSLCSITEGICQSSRDASLSCRTELRLSGGPNNQSGRVEVFFGDEWGTVCDDSFDDNAASVVCRMLGYNPKGAKARGRAAYGKGSGRVMIDELRCTGSETDISECKSNYWASHTNCRHDEDVSIECGTEIRLSDGPTSFSGRLEIKSRHSWNTMCDDAFDNKTAHVVCNMLGFKTGNITVHTNAFYGQGSNEVSNYRLECLGNETDIVDCKHTHPAGSCSHVNDVGINCYSVTPIRLQGGPTPYSGRVEVYIQEQSSWMGICDDSYGFTVDDAKVLCRMIGKPNLNPSFHRAAGLYDYTIRGNGLSNMNCTGTEQDITDCRSGQRWLETTCTYQSHVGINCDPVTNVRLVDGPSVRAGRVEIQYNGTWGTICSDGFDTKDSDVICSMLGFTQESYLLTPGEYNYSNAPSIITNVQCKGDERDISDCRAHSWMYGSCSSGVHVGIACNSTVRLSNGTNERSGRVEVLYKGKWGTVCSDGFDVNAANVVCRMVGFRFWNAIVLSGSQFGRGNGYVIISTTNCDGTEPDLATCASSPWNNTVCKNDLVATVDCHVQHTNLRLVNGETIYSGRVHVIHNNKSGTICYNQFTKANAEVICSTLGYKFTSDITYSYDNYGYEQNKVMISNLDCNGNETDISECPSDDWDTGNENCTTSYYQSANVNCLTPIKLRGGRTKSMGRVEVQHENAWGSICSDNFIEENIPVICSMLGFNYTKTFQMVENIFHSESRIYPVVVQNLTCNGTEKDVQQCRSSSWERTYKCSTSNTAAVNCNSPIRLKGSTNWRSGRAQMYSDGNWTNICYVDNSTSEMVSKVICRMMGLSTWNITMYPKKGSTGVNVTCSGYEEDISRCNIQKSQCVNSTVLGIQCDTGIRLIYGRTDYMGVVSVYIHDQWESVRQVQNEDTADAVCRMLGYNFTRYNDIQTRRDLRKSYSGRQTITQLICDGDESDIMDCKDSYRNPDSSYGYSNGVNCQTPIQLTHGSKYQFGQVELKDNKTWYKMCSEGFTVENAHVICRMLGHKHVRNTTRFYSESATDGPFMTGYLQCNGREVDISQCPNSWTPITCTKGVVSLDCRSSARLLDGPTKFKGRPEILYDGKWIPLCYSSGSNNAKVLCRRLGYNYNNPVIHSGVPYQNNTVTRDNYTITNLQCVGTEEDITECSSDEWQSGTCFYERSLEIECNSRVYLGSGSNQNIGYVRVGYNDDYRTICGDGFGPDEADVVCRMMGIATNRNATIYKGNRFFSHYSEKITGLKCIGNETDLQECNSTSWSSSTSNCSTNNDAVSVNCRPKTPIRINGSNKSSGLVEINYYGYWGTIHVYSVSSGISNKDANVICGMLGYKTGLPSSPRYVRENDIIIGNLACKGTENDISECSSYGWSTYRSYSNDNHLRATVQCTDDRVRLVNGVNDYQGRIEFQYIGLWGTVCEKYFDESDAEVVCRQIGFPSDRHAIIYNTTHFGENSRSLIIDDLKCSGNEEDLDDCASYPWAPNNYTCSYSHRSAGINCRPKTPVRLVNGSSKYWGRVEVEYKGSYGTVCDRDFDENDAKVVCRMMGFSTLSTAYRKHAYYGQGSNKITISHLRCDGSELDISECRAGYRWDSPYAYCTHGHDVSVQCDTPVRLRGGWTQYDGLVEVFINSSWTSVCYDAFTQQDAQTVCNIAGLRKHYNRSQNVSIHRGSFYSIQSYPIVGEFGCNGNEDDLYNCGSSRWTRQTKQCDTQNNVAINCRPATLIRLTDKAGEVKVPIHKNHSITGRVEVYYRNKWGSICDDQFDDSDAQVLCNMLGLPYGNVYRGKDNQLSNGTILIDDLDCLGIEKDVSECKAREWGTHNCGHDEDVAITCEYKKDPCHAKANIRLPNLELRYVNVNTTRLHKALNDSKLPFRWYNVGNNTMPIKPPPKERCGTHFPIYSTYNSETLQPNASTTIKATQVGDSQATIEIEMKNCYGQFYVYRLRPTNNDESGYCFGVGSEEPAPTFVPKTVSAIVDYDEKGVSYVCKFEPSTEDLYYQVKWQVEGNSHMTLTKQYFRNATNDKLRLTEKDFEDNDISLGVNISCAVRAFTSPNGQPGPLSEYSKPSFFGIKILTSSVSLRSGETKSLELINTVPIICYSDDAELNEIIKDACDIRLEHTTPDYGTKPCSKKPPTFKDGCDTKLTNDGLSEITRINISAPETVQYIVAGHFKIYLSAQPKSYIKLWRKVYKLPVINVEVLPETDTRWRGSVCSARNDPHMFTFDKKMYEHHENGGEYILYRHKYYTNVEVQHKIAPCTNGDSKAKCNCGVAVRAGRDVYVINVCDKLLDIGHKHCGDETLTVKKDNDFTYTIYLPFGTAVRARIDNQPYMGNEGGKVLDISILPSVHDKDGYSTGLCGTLNNNTDDDFQHRNKSVGTIGNLTQFIESWRVLRNESLFSANVESVNLVPWVFPMCTCANVSFGSAYSCKKSVSDCTPGMRIGQHSCEEVSSRRSVRSLTNRARIPVVRQTQHYAQDHQVVKRRAATTDSLNRSTAAKYCEQYFLQSETFKLCQNVPSTHTHVSVENCILDILLTNTYEWASLSKQSMQDTCTTEIHRNASVRQEIVNKARNATIEAEFGAQSGTTVMPQTEIREIEQLEKTIKSIKEIACLNNCSGNGNCSDGVCVCKKGYGASDCSLNINKPPRLELILHDGLCDEKSVGCTHIYVFGEVFVGTNVTCRLRKFTMGPLNQTRTYNSLVHIKGTAETLIEAVCPVDQQTLSRKRRSESEQLPDHFVHGYQVAVSNDGEHFSNRTLDAFVFDSTCQTYTNDTMGMIFKLRTEFCHIEGKCVRNGSLSITQTMVCDPMVSKYRWTPVPTTTQSSTSTIVTGYTRRDPNTTISEIVKSKPNQHAYRLELTIDIANSSIRKLNIPQTYQEYVQETKTVLERYYRLKLGIGLTDVVIVSLRPGSLIIQHAVIIENEGFVVKALSLAIAGLSRGEKLQLFGQNYTVYNVQIENNKVGKDTGHYQEFLLCDSYTALHPCKEHEICVIEKETPTCKGTTTNQGNTNLMIIISSTVGGVLVIIIFALVVVICCNRKKHKNKLADRSRTTVENQYHDMDSTEMTAIPKAKLHSGNKQGNHDLGVDNSSYKHDEHDADAANKSVDSRSNSTPGAGSCYESNDGYTYYFGKKKL